MKKSMSYKVAVFFDVHGNHLALKAVLKSASEFSPDSYIFGGDIVSGAAQARECLDEFKRVNAIGVIGNTDEKVIAGACEVTSWTKAQLQDEDLELLSSLPLNQRIHPPGSKSPEDDLLIVHSTPRSCNDFLVLNPRRPGPTRSGQKTSDEDLKGMLNGEEFHTMLFGHIHYTSERFFEGRKLMSIVPVGLPEDDDVRAGFALASWDGNDWVIDIKRVEYDSERAAQIVEGSDQPYAARYAEMIRRATFLPKPKPAG